MGDKGQEVRFTLLARSLPPTRGQERAATTRACPPFGAGQEQHVSSGDPTLWGPQHTLAWKKSDNKKRG